MTEAADKSYKDHRAGSRKGAVHEIFDKQGVEKALAYGVKHDLKESTLKQWMRSWKAGKSASKKPAAAKTPKAAKPVKKKTGDAKPAKAKAKSAVEATA